MATPRDIARVTSQRRAQERIEHMRLTPRQIERERLAARRMHAIQRGYTGPLTREELSKR
jgi:DNA-binding transcriptional regulator YdaS (Cro superfamily)